jgi:hypothetical protein
VAYDMSGTIEGIPIVYVLDRARMGQAVMLFGYGDLGSPPTSQVVHLLRVAATKGKG